jgi:hypothetical protein
VIQRFRYRRNIIMSAIGLKRVEALLEGLKRDIDWGSTTHSSQRLKVESLITTKTLTTADSGKIFMLNLAGGFTVTLPSATATNVAGCHFTFIVGTDPTTAYIIAGGTADKMAGKVVCSAGGNEDEENAITGDQMNFVANTALIGDKVEIFCDGTGFYGYGITGAAGGITITG